MNTTFRRFLAIVLFASLLSGTQVFAQGTAFTYQGRLNIAGAPATGTYDFQFAVWNASSGGSAVGAAPLSSTVAVSNGLFTVALDPGAGVFTGPARWLEIAVRTNGGGAFTTNAPRQPLTATPYAVRASAAAIASGVTPGAVTAAGLAPGAVSQVSNPSGTINALQSDANGLIAIGTNAPRAGLDIATGSSIVAPRLLVQLRDDVNGYTNLAGVYSVVTLGNLLAVGANHDSGITLIDITDPQAPVLLSQIRDGNGPFTNLLSVNSLVVKSNLLVATGANSDSITLIGITNPAAPVKLGHLTDGVGGWNELSNPYGLALNGNVLAIAALNDSAVTLADISNPSAPIKRVEMKDEVFGFTNLNGAISVAISGNLLAIGAFHDNAVTFVDISNPANPVKLSEIKDGMGGFNNLSSVYHVAFSTDGKLLAIAAAYENAVTLVSVTNPSNPVKVAELVDGVNGVNYLAIPTATAFSANRLAVAGALDRAVTLFDISTPSAPQVLTSMRDGVAGFDFLAAPFSVTFAGTNLVMGAAEDDAVTITAFGTATVGLTTQNRVGIGTTQPAAALEVVGDVIISDAMIFDANAEKVELGVAAAAAGTNAVAVGKGARALGTSSVAIGDNTLAQGVFSTALGTSTKALGDFSLAAGNSTEASGGYSVAFGGFGKSLGDYSFSVGYDNEASGYGSISMGLQNVSSGFSSAAIGRLNHASGQAAFALGTRAYSMHSGSFVWGDNDDVAFASTGPNQFLIRAGGGVGINTNSGGGVALNVAGTVAATNFVGRFTGNGSGLTNVPGTTSGNYVFAFDGTIQNVAVANTFQDVTFTSNGQISGWTHTASSANFVNSQAGLYLIQYTVQTETSAAGATTVSMRLLLNGTEVNGSQCSTEPNTASQTMLASKSVLASIPASAILRLQFTGTSTNNRLIAGGAGVNQQSASISIVRIQ